MLISSKIPPKEQDEHRNKQVRGLENEPGSQSYAVNVKEMTEKIDSEQKK